MKKVWIAIAATAAVLMLALLIMNFAVPKEKTESGDTESLYPYYYETAKDNALVLHITGEHDENYRWCAETNAERVAVTEKKQKKAEAVFQITPVESGEATAVFSLQKDGTLPERLYEITVRLYVNGDGKISILSNFHKELTGTTGGDGEDFSYRSASQADGTILVSLENTGSAEWLVEVDGDSVYVSTEEQDEQAALYRICCDGLGQSSVYLCNTATGKAVELYVTTDRLSRVRLVEDRIIDHVYTEHEPAAETDEFTQAFGTVTLPEGTEIRETGMTPWTSRADQATEYTVGSESFALDGKEWTLYLSNEAKAEDFTAACAQQNQGQSAVMAENLAGNAYIYEGGGASSWTDESGRSYMLKGSGVTMEELVSATEKVMKATANG